MTEPAAPAPSLSALAGASLKVGLLGFGGPAGQIALMHRVFVEERGWIGEERYLKALNFCMLLPGPEAQQLATYVGWTLRGTAGGLIAGLLFVLPGALVMLGVSALYVLHADETIVQAIFYGVRAAVIALIVDAIVRIGRRALSGRSALLIASAALAALVIFSIPFPLVILAAALLGALRGSEREAAAPAPAETPQAKGGLRVGAICAAIWVTPLAATVAWFGPGHVLSEIGLLFSTLSLVTFGGAYATLAYLQQQAVDEHGWLSPAQMLDGLGLAEATPGPLVLVNQFVGFVAGWQAEGGGFGLALAAGALATWCTFAPSFLWIFAAGPMAERLSANPRAASALRAVTAATVGVIASLGLKLAAATLFTQISTTTTRWGAVIETAAISSLDLFATLLAALALAALVSRRFSVLSVLFFCSLAGCLWKLFG